MLKPRLDKVRRLVATTLKSTLQQVKSISSVVIGHPSKPSRFGFQPKPCDREEPRAKLGARSVLTQPEEGGHEALLGHFVDIDAGRPAGSQPRPQGALKSADSFFESSSIAALNPPDRIVNPYFVIGSLHSLQYTIAV